MNRREILDFIEYVLVSCYVNELAERAHYTPTTSQRYTLSATCTLSYLNFNLCFLPKGATDDKKKVFLLGKPQKNMFLCRRKNRNAQICKSTKTNIL